MTVINPMSSSAISSEDRAEDVLRYNVRKYLRARGVSQNSLQDVLHLTSGAVSQLMTGRSQFKFKQVVAVAHYLGVTLDELVDDTYYSQDEIFMEKMREHDEEFINKIKGGNTKRAPTDNRPRFFVGAPSGIRTPDTLIKSQLL